MYPASSSEVHPRQGFEVSEPGLVVGEFALIVGFECQDIEKGRNQGFEILSIGLIGSQCRTKRCLRLRDQTFAINLELLGRSFDEYVLLLNFSQLLLWLCLQLF